MIENTIVLAIGVGLGIVFALYVFPFVLLIFAYILSVVSSIIDSYQMSKLNKVYKKRQEALDEINRRRYNIKYELDGISGVHENVIHISAMQYKKMLESHGYTVEIERIDSEKR